MADVNRLLSGDCDDRGQLLLVGALTLAVLLVALAVLLNAAIYTGNVATRDAGPEAGDAIEYENEATSMARETMASLNGGEDMTDEELRQNFTRTVENWSEMAQVHPGVSLADAEVEVDSIETDTSNISSVELNLTYRTTDIYYRTEFQVTEDESDD